MNVKPGRPKFVLRKVVIGLDKSTSDDLSDLVRSVQAIDGQNETDAIRYSIQAMVRAMRTSETVLQDMFQNGQPR